MECICIPLCVLICLPFKYIFLVIDSTGKPPAGLTTDISTKWVGNYEECVKNPDLKYCGQSGILFGGRLVSIFSSE